jgi:hypothetical protein
MSNWWKEQCRSAQGLGFMRGFGIGCKVSRDLGRGQFLSGQEFRLKNGNAAVSIPFSWSSSIEVRLLYDCTQFVLSLLLEVCFEIHCYPLVFLLIMHTILFGCLSFNLFSKLSCCWPCCFFDTIVETTICKQNVSKLPRSATLVTTYIRIMKIIIIFWIMTTRNVF